MGVLVRYAWLYGGWGNRERSIAYMLARMSHMYMVVRLDDDYIISNGGKERSYQNFLLYVQKQSSIQCFPDLRHGHVKLVTVLEIDTETRLCHCLPGMDLPPSMPVYPLANELSNRSLTEIDSVQGKSQEHSAF